jgi:cyclic pyranopterin phosphate synthase
MDEQGNPRMVDVGEKAVSHRVAVAEGRIRLLPETCRMITEGETPKGNVLVTAELAGVQAAKQTSTLIPLCHPLMISKALVEATLEEDGVLVRAEVRCTGQTGVEMEALTATSVALLTVYDMCKAVDKEMEISGVCLVSKTKEEV